MKTALVLGGAHAHIPLLQHLSKQGFYTVLVDYHTHPVARPFADRHLCESAMDAEAVLKWAVELRAELVISTSSDQLNVTACWVAEQLGLPAPYSHQTSLDVTHKLRMKQKMQAHGIPTAPFVCLAEEQPLETLPLTLPLIVKPVDNCGSKGVRPVRQAAEFAPALRAALHCSRDQRALVERFDSGREICVDAYVQDGVPHVIAIYEKFNLISSETVVQCFRSLRPVLLAAEAEARLLEILVQLVQAFALRQTALFVQTIVQDTQVSVIEFAARVPGGLAYRASQLASGFDAVAANLDAFLQRPARLELARSSDYITTNSIYAAPGPFGWVTGHEALLKAGVIDEFWPYKTPGMTLGAELASQDRVAGFIVRDANKDRLFERIALALESLEIYTPEGQPVMRKTLFRDIRDQHVVKSLDDTLPSR